MKNKKRLKKLKSGGTVEERRLELCFPYMGHLNMTQASLEDVKDNELWQQEVAPILGKQIF